MFVKIGDKVKVIAGSEKGKEGTVLSVNVKKNRVVVKLFNCKHGEPPFKNTHRKRHDSQ